MYLYFKKSGIIFFGIVLGIFCCLSSEAAFLGAREKQASCSKEEYFAQHDLCENEIARAEKKYSIPHRLLLAIGTVESGRSLNQKNKVVWPWTICANGKSYYCSTKSAAIATVKRLMARGIRNIDVGCMQVNLLHHSRAFKNLEEAFTPRNNVEYAASFLSELKNMYNSWTCAVGYYHSKASRYYKPYCSSVYRAWVNVRDKVIHSSPRIQMAAADTSSKISFLPPYYSITDSKISEKLHKLGRQTLVRNTPKFFQKSEK